MIDDNRKMTLFALAWPMFVETFLRLLLGNVNVFMLSRYSEDAVGAVGVSNQIISMVLVIYSIVGTGTAIIISQYIGAGKKDTASKAAGTAIVFNLTMGMILSLLLSFFSRQILIAVRLPAELMGYASQYIVIVGAASFIQALTATMSSIIRSYGYTKFPMYVALGMNLFNIMGCYLAVFRPFGLPSYGVSGVAASVVTSNILGVTALSWMLFRKLRITFSLKSFRPFPIDVLRNIFKIGAPAAGEYISYNFSQMAVTYIIAVLGAVAINTKIYVQNLTFFIHILGLTVGQATQILVGYNIGAGNVAEAKKLCMKGFKIALASNTTMSLVFLMLRISLLGIFTSNPEQIKLGSIILIADVVIELGRPFNHIIANALRGAGDVRYPALLGIASMWGIGVVYSYIFGIHLRMGLLGVWVAFAFDEWLRGLLILKRWRSGSWQRMSIINTKNEVLKI